ncbi:unnamed protein product [marine sediment metagenome]|uniref:Uncharacterized protein n=1 Tax=marine sediment metagenome TaxID=412755 RepID=X0SV11_9ZZZZ
MPRTRRKAPDREPNPLDVYSSWDLRYAKLIYYGFILGTVIVVLGVWGVLINFLFSKGAWDVWLDLDLGFQIAIIAGAVTGHLFLLVLFYTLFRGGMVRLCQIMFKDRLIANKWTDYYGLRMLIGVALLGLYVTLISVVIGLLPSAFLDVVQKVWDWQVEKFKDYPGMWIMWVGLLVFIFVVIIFIGIMIWNKGVFWVLSHVKEIEEEIEIEENIKKEAIKNSDERTLRDIYKKEMGQKPIHRGRETSGYREWKDKLGIK